MNRPVATTAFRDATPAGFTAIEFLRMASLGAFDDMRVELSHGEILRMSPSYSPHSGMHGQLVGKLFAAVADPAMLHVDPLIRITDDTVRGPDAALLAATAGSDIVDAADVRLAVEIADTSLAQDLGTKSREYASSGIPVYWVIDVNACVVHVMREPQGDSYTSRDVVRFGEPLAVPGSDATIMLE